MDRTYVEKPAISQALLNASPIIENAPAYLSDVEQMTRIAGGSGFKCASTPKTLSKG